VFQIPFEVKRVKVVRVSMGKIVYAAITPQFLLSLKLFATEPKNAY
jgi:hypothetical protein